MTWYVFGPVGIRLSTIFIIYSAVTCLLFRDDEIMYSWLKTGTLAWFWMMSLISSIGGYTLEEKAVGIAMVVIISIIVAVQWIRYLKKMSTETEMHSSSRYVTDAFAKVDSKESEAESDILSTV